MAQRDCDGSKPQGMRVGCGWGEISEADPRPHSKAEAGVVRA